MILTLAFCFSELFWYILRWANDSMHKISWLFSVFALVRYRSVYHTFFVFSRQNLLFFKFFFLCVWRNEHMRFECRICVLRLAFSVFNQIRYEHSYYGEWPDVTPYNNISCYHSPTIILRYYTERSATKVQHGNRMVKKFFSITIAISW